MSNLPSGYFSGPTGELVDNLREDYLGDLRDATQSLSNALSNGQTGGKNGTGSAELIDQARQFAFEMKGDTANFELKLLNAVSHRLGDYVSEIKQLGKNEYSDIFKFLDAISGVLDGDIDGSSDVSLFVRDLPAKRAADFDENSVEVRELEILLVMLHGTATHFVQRELHACGYRVSIITSVYDALRQIVLTKPNMVIISAVMDEVSGVDLALALNAMPTTRNVPTALITSYDKGHESLSLLPSSVPVIKKGSSFGDDIAEALEHHFLL